jgi:hypothetical protein
VKKYSSAIKFLRVKFKAAAAEGAGKREAISRLTWKDMPEAQEALSKLRVARKAGGRQTIGKRALKPYRRPETGPERYSLWADKRATGHEARHCILAMGLLKERPYLSMEPACHEDHKPSCGYILDLIHEALGDDKALKAEWTQERIVDLILMAAAKKEAA